MQEKETTLSQGQKGSKMGKRTHKSLVCDLWKSGSLTGL